MRAAPKNIWRQAAGKRVERWRRIAHEAAQQSRRIAPPQIAEPVKLADALPSDAELRIVLAENEPEATLERNSSRAQRVQVAGAGGRPRRRLEPKRLVELRAGRMDCAASLGDTILRAETAAIAALAVARAEF